MEAFKLRIPDQDPAELMLGTGVHGIGRRQDGATTGGRIGMGLVEESQSPLLQFCVDRRGVWMTVGDDTRGVHVNGRPVLRMAMLRSGDTVFVDGVEMVLLARQNATAMPQAVHAASVEPVADPRVVLRGIGGQHHGRSFTLERPRVLGRARDADIRIDDPSFAEQHARVELHAGQVVLRDLGSPEGSLVNGERVRDAVLQSGDQVVLDGQHRFVLEAPARGTLQHEPYPAGVESEAEAANQEAAAWSHSARRLPWLLLAALLLAAALAALLLGGL